MSRLRHLVATAVAAVATVAPIVTSAGVAAAASPLRPSIVCDSATNTISTSVSGGNLVPNTRYTVEFRVQYGSYVTATGRGVIAGMGTVLSTVPAVSAADGTISATGYSRSWPASSYVFYTETVRAGIKNTAGNEIIAGTATCTRDLRTTVTLTCDQQTRTITATAAGTGYTTESGLYVEYTYETTSQRTADDYRWTRANLMPPDIVHTARPTGGAWSDVGYVHQVTTDLYYLSESLRVVVRDNYNLIVGRGEAVCVYADQAAT